MGPDQQRTTPQERRAAQHSGHEDRANGYRFAKWQGKPNFALPCMRVKQALSAIHGNPRRERVTTRSSDTLNYPSNFIGHGHPNKPANGERMIRQGVGGLAIGSGASNHWRAIGTRNRISPLLIARWITGRFYNWTGAALGKGAAKSKRRCQMFQGHIDLDAATPVKQVLYPTCCSSAACIGERTFRGVNLVAAHKCQSAALKGRADAIQLAPRVAELMSESRSPWPSAKPGPG